MEDEDGKLPPKNETDQLQDVLDSEDTAMSALNDLVGREDFDSMSDDDIINFFKEYNLTDDDISELLDDLTAMQDADYENPNLSAQDMADEDNTPVEVTGEDSDGDGDTDKETIEKKEPEDDAESDKDNSSESEDKPHDKDITSDVRLKNIDNSTNSIARTLANYRW